MIIHNLEQGSEEWLQMRIGKFTGSDFHLFFGDSVKKETELLKKTAERITGKRADAYSFSNKHTQRGHDLEPEARSLYELLNDVTVKEVGFVTLDKDVGCSPDGLVGDEGIVEIKCPDNHIFLKHLLKGNKAIAQIYKTQMQFNMYVTGRQWCDYICYNPNFTNPFYVETIERDNEQIDKIINCIDECNLDINKKIQEIVDKEEIKEARESDERSTLNDLLPGNL